MKRKPQPQPSKGSPASGERSDQEEYNDLARSTPRTSRSPFSQHSEPRGQQQEWTQEYVRELASHHDGMKRVADAHNVALAAAWQEHDDVADALANFSDTIKQLGARNQQLNKELAAERQRREQELHQLAIYLEGNCYSDPDFMAGSRALKAAVKLHDHLLSALATIESIRNNWSTHELTNEKLAAILRDYSSTALHEHDEGVGAKNWNEGYNEAMKVAAEVREPLVEAITRVIQWLRKNEQLIQGANLLNVNENRQLCDALAKVKEGK